MIDTKYGVVESDNEIDTTTGVVRYCTWASGVASVVLSTSEGVYLLRCKTLAPVALASAIRSPGATSVGEMLVLDVRRNRWAVL